MNGISRKNLMKLGELIKIVGHKGLEIKFYKHDQPASELNARMAGLPKSFHVCPDTNRDIQWKEGVIWDSYGLEYISVTMFYKKGEEVKK